MSRFRGTRRRLRLAPLCSLLVVFGPAALACCLLVSAAWSQVDEPLNLGTKPGAASPAAAPAPAVEPFAGHRTVQRAERIVVAPSPGMTELDAWKHHFGSFESSEPEKLHKLAADIRETCRQLKREQKYKELIDRMYDVAAA